MIPLAAYQGKRIAVLGMARSGVAAVNALAAAGAHVIAWDDNEKTRAKYDFDFVDLTTADLSGIDAICMSPGISHTFPAPHPVAARAKAAGIPLINDIELFASVAPQLPKHSIVAITGTNGKSTTTALVAHILKGAGRAVAMGGNIGVPVLDLDPVAEGGTYVFELSSYQLEQTTSLHADAAILLNITPDHLDRHGGMDGYIAAKARLFQMQRLDQKAVIGIDDAACAGQAAAFGGRVIPVSVRQTLDKGLCVRAGVLYEDGVEITNLNGIRTLKGAHNWQNAACAYGALRAIGLKPDEIIAGIRSFPGLAHRQEIVAEIAGVPFINDSKATNNDAAATALAAYDNIYWIAGGRPKTTDLSDLAIYFPKIRGAYLIGEAAEPYAAQLDGKIASTICGTLEVAVPKAYEDAKGTGGVVLFSPACASFDQFADFEQRGDAFRAAVKTLAGSAK